MKYQHLFDIHPYGQKRESEMNFKEEKLISNKMKDYIYKF